ncbi:MAG: SDR family NAD(P)-dependent oxidoreductase [Bacteroidota bacterium]
MEDIKKYALVTGVSRATGLGLEISRQLAQAGYVVYAAARKLPSVKELTSALQAASLDVRPLQLDITQAESIAAAREKVAQETDQLAILVNNAAAFFDAGARAIDADPAKILRAFDTNTLGAWRMIQVFRPLLATAPYATVTNVTSGAGSFTDPLFGMSVHPQHVPVYAATKAAANAMTVKLAQELREENILVNAVCPGWVATYPGTAEMGARPVADGARGVVWAATLSADGPTGGFFRDGEPLGW